jgi:hypothetical protein
MYPHTLQPPETTDDASVDVDALCDLFDRSGTPVMYLNTTLSDADAQAIFDGHQLVSELDAVRGVSALRHATDEELAQAELAHAATKAPAQPHTTTDDDEPTKAQATTVKR